MMQRRYILRNPEKRQKHVRIWVSVYDSDSDSDSWSWSWSVSRAVVLGVALRKTDEQDEFY
jgi:hypothetical protein